MDKKTLTELDFYRIRDEIASFCLSEEGKFVFSRLEPLTDLDDIEKNKSLSREWTSYINTTSSQALSSWPAVFSVFKSLKIQGISISLEQFYAIGQFCKSIEKVGAFIKSAEIDLGMKNLLELINTIPDLSVVSNEIFKIITSDGELRDLPQIRAIRTKISNLNLKLKNIMHSFTSDSKLSNVLESNIPVLRGGRQVLAVKSNQRSFVSGIIHEVSQSGQTVYIEPEDCVKCTNEIVEAEFELQSETRKILKELASRISPFSADLFDALKVMEKLDCTLAIASWGKVNSCVFSDSCVDEPLWLVGARHPLLGEKAVPIDVHFLDGKRILIITGPNTGGKTVTLKTIALFAMLNQTGFPVPAKEGTRLPVFSGVFADIGDEQSLDESLSTFSGHMKNIAKAVRNVNENSLVLLDELGGGTDPQEGSAISMAVLDRLIEKKAFVLITTHHGAIKNYGYTHKECINASVEFNSDTLSPTYHILMGVPGESHALDIAKRSGLPNDIVQNAKNYIISEKADVSSLIKGLTEKHSELDSMMFNFKNKENELLDKIRKNDLKSLSLRQKEHEIKQGIQIESQKFLEQSRKQLENLVRTLKEGEVTRDKTLSVKKYISDLTENVNIRDEKLAEEEIDIEQEKNRVENEDKKRISHKATKKRMKNSEALSNATPVTTEKAESDKNNSDNACFCIGADVLGGVSKQKGVIISSCGKDKWNVQFGSITITMKQKDLVLANINRNIKPVISYSVDLAANSNFDEKPVFELRLIGMRVEEAIRALEKQLDLCSLQNFRQFSIIHGKGSGVLQQVVHDYLSNCSSVADFKFAPPEDGGFGKTYVSLR